MGILAYVTLGLLPLQLPLPTPTSIVHVLIPKIEMPTGMSSIFTGTVPVICSAGSMLGPSTAASATMLSCAPAMLMSATHCPALGDWQTFAVAMVRLSELDGTLTVRTPPAVPSASPATVPRLVEMKSSPGRVIRTDAAFEIVDACGKPAASGVMPHPAHPLHPADPLHDASTIKSRT